MFFFSFDKDTIGWNWVFLPKRKLAKNVSILEHNEPHEFSIPVKLIFCIFLETGHIYPLRNQKETYLQLFTYRSKESGWTDFFFDLSRQTIYAPLKDVVAQRVFHYHVYHIQNSNLIPLSPFNPNSHPQISDPLQLYILHKCVHVPPPSLVFVVVTCTYPWALRFIAYYSSNFFYNSHDPFIFFFLFLLNFFLKKIVIFVKEWQQLVVGGVRLCLVGFYLSTWYCYVYTISAPCYKRTSRSFRDISSPIAINNFSSPFYANCNLFYQKPPKKKKIQKQIEGRNTK